MSRQVSLQIRFSHRFLPPEKPAKTKSPNSNLKSSRRSRQSQKMSILTSISLIHPSKKSQSFSGNSSTQAMRNSVRLWEMPLLQQRQHQRNLRQKTTETEKRSKPCGKNSASSFRQFRNATESSSTRLFRLRMHGNQRLTQNIRKSRTSILKHLSLRLSQKSTECRQKSTQGFQHSPVKSLKNRLRLRQKFPAWLKMSRQGLPISQAESKANLRSFRAVSYRNSPDLPRALKQKSMTCRKMSLRKSQVSRARSTQKSMICMVQSKAA